MRIAKQLFQEKYHISQEWIKKPSYKLLENYGFIHFFDAGFPIFLPIGKRIVDKICTIIRNELGNFGFDEIYLPLIQDKNLLEKTGRASIFAKELIELKNDFDGYILSSTNEEFFLELAKASLSSYRQLPIKWFQIADKFRNVQKPKGILRTRQFLMCDAISINESKASLYKSALQFEQVVNSVFQKMGVFPLRISKDSGNYVDFLIPCQEGETKIILNEGSACYARYDDENAINASSIAMYFLFDHPEIRNVIYQGQTKRHHIFLGTYGFGIQRCLHAIVEIYRDDLGINFPIALCPFDLSISVLDPKDKKQLIMGEDCYQYLTDKGYEVLFDDRLNKTLSDKMKLSDFYGIPVKLIIGRNESESNTIMIKKRNEENSLQISFDLNIVYDIYLSYLRH